ncbi:hypothetical protein DdX_16517 [Ditylenchus destructor]|uniref:Uncharacterized protein n=1 Tax=Ditylenchus destructor TaxID=166010 RepID=A0AAD4MNA8_9BILA|nr:hypothetical protein DdX_16517 [Ditylenchus destructor]
MTHVIGGLMHPQVDLFKGVGNAILDGCSASFCHLFDSSDDSNQIIVLAIVPRVGTRRNVSGKVTIAMELPAPNGIGFGVS